MKSLKMIIGIVSVVCLLLTGAMAQEYLEGVSFFIDGEGSGDGQTVYCKSSPLSALEYGDWVCQTDNIELGTVDGPVQDGTVCELQCDQRYSIASGHYEVTCTQNGWENHPDQSENPPKCLDHPKSCGELPDKQNGIWKCAEDVESRVCSMSCDPFYDHFDGNTTVCTKSGWYPDPADISCVTCKSPPPPSHGSWNCNDFGNIVEYQHTIRVCAAYCDGGFTNTGSTMTLCSITGRDTFTPNPQLSVCQPACPDLPKTVNNGTWSCQKERPPFSGECFLTCDKGATLIGDGITSCGLGSVWTSQDVEKCIFSLTVEIENAIDKSKLNGMLISLMVDGEIYNQSIVDRSGHVQLYSPHGEVVIEGKLDGFQMEPITITVGVEEVQDTINISARPTCPILPAVVKNGTWMCEEWEAPYANDCVLRCDTGSTLIGDGVASCGLGSVWTDEDDKCIFPLTISTVNAVNNSRLGGMLVFLMVDGQIYDQSQTNSSGYTKLNSPHGSVTITGEMDGWKMDPINTVVGSGIAQRTIEALALPEGVSILTISTANAINNHQVGGMLVSLHAQNRVFSQATTNSVGEAKLASPHGEVVITGEKDGFQMAPITMTVTDQVSKSDIKISASPETSEPARVVMNWGRLPADLDLHTKQVSGTSTLCHCSYSKKQCSGFALDIDNTRGGHNGAETITWSHLDVSNQYVVYVHDYSGTSTTHLTGSAARLAIYMSGQRPTQVNVPTRGAASRYWLVGCFNSDGRNGFTIINQLRTTEPTSC